MYVFGIAVLLGLAVVAVALIIERFARFGAMATELWALLLVALGVGTAWLADFSLFTAWQIPVREDWIGIILTGIALAGIAQVWYVTGSLVKVMQRKFLDEAESMEKEKGLRRVA